VNRFPLAALAALLAVGVLAGCSQSDEPAPAQQAAAPQAPAQAPAAQPPVPPNHPPMTGHPPVQAPVAMGGANTGTVVSAQQAGGYTYIEVDANGQRRWLASSPVRVAPGDQLRWGDSAVMRNFTSKSLGRTFDELLFVSGVQPVGAGAPAASGNVGKVLSMVNSAGYAYLELETAGGTKWLAASQAPVKVGDTVAWQGGSVMNNFTSTSLNRTFDQIIFVAAVSPAQQ
jgi:plastocyanin